jgi:predicted Rossmann-fold nucleotide-binding protein
MTIVIFLLIHWENWPEPQLERARKFARSCPQKQEFNKILTGGLRGLHYFTFLYSNIQINGI